ncbi:MAG: DUF2905 domain-containing protein [Planctomycetales bacterium]|nr:DUF2905 domain-containing protein [Planctomycetales bacterium]
MQELEPQQLAKWLIGLGLGLVAVGILVFGLSKLGFFRLPGDLSFGGKNWRFFFPVTTCVLISLVMTFLFWLVRYFGRK